MCDNLSIADKLTRVRDKLTSDKVQLWTPPYYVAGIGPSDSDIQILAERYSAILGLPTACCVCALTELQSAALENLESRTQFNESGIQSSSAVLCYWINRSLTFALPISVLLLIFVNPLPTGTASFKIKGPNGTIKATARLEQTGDVVLQQVADKLVIPKER